MDTSNDDQVVSSLGAFMKLAYTHKQQCLPTDLLKHDTGTNTLC